MLSIEVLIVIAQLCLSTGKADKDIQQSVRCNQQVIKCTTQTYKDQWMKDINKALTECYTTFEISR